MKYSPLKTQWPWLSLPMTSKVKCYKVNRNAIYDLLYVFRINFDHNYEMQPFESSVTLIWPLDSIKGQISSGKLTDHKGLCICVSYKYRW